MKKLIFKSQFKEKLIKHIKEELITIKSSIIERAVIYQNEEWDEEDLFDINMDKYPVIAFDTHDFGNHNFDMGKYYAYKELLVKLKNKEL